MEGQKRQWVRNHRDVGFVVGHCTGEYEGHVRDLLVVQTTIQVVLMPVGTVIPVDDAYVQRQAALDLETIIRSLQTGGFSLEMIEDTWQRAITHIQDVHAAVPITTNE